MGLDYCDITGCAEELEPLPNYSSTRTKTSEAVFYVRYVIWSRRLEIGDTAISVGGEHCLACELRQ
jgi:hypothetical protein